MKDKDTKLMSYIAQLFDVKEKYYFYKNQTKEIFAIWKVRG